ncbi:N-acetyltransferase [Sphingobacterium faecium NBRC 15299]|nr:acetyltransferase (GNAT) family protein [Sphingobacterium faecium]GEM63574.1 N-acetyltransferase [Sphingobacterium faecium NBRC 15299]
MIRKGIPKDIIQAAQVLEEVKAYMLNIGIDQWDQEYPNRIVLTQDIDREEAFIYEEQGELLAYMVLNEKCDQEYAELNWKTATPFVVIHRLYVKPSAQGKGISSKMIKYSEQFALENKYQSIRFDAFSLNETANAVYIKKGYASVGTVLFRKGVFNCYEKAM